MSDLPYDVRWSATARRWLAERLPEPVAAAVVELVLGALSHDPRRVGKPLRTNSIMQSVQRVQSALNNSLHAGSSPELEAKMRAFAGALTVCHKVRALPGPAQ